MPVHDNILRSVEKVTAVYDQHTGRVILDRVDTAAERTSVDGQGRSISAFTTVANHAGVTAIIIHGNTRIDFHLSIIGNGIKAITAICIGRICSLFLRTLKRTTIQHRNTIVYDSTLCVCHIIHRAAAVDDQGRPILNSNGIAAIIGQRLTVQIEGQVLVNGDIFLGVCNQLHGLSLSCRVHRILQRRILSLSDFCDRLTRRLRRPRHRRDADRHHQRQNGCQYLFHFSYPGFFRFPQPASF